MEKNTHGLLTNQQLLDIWILIFVLIYHNTVKPVLRGHLCDKEKVVL